MNVSGTSTIQTLKCTNLTANTLSLGTSLTIPSLSTTNITASNNINPLGTITSQFLNVSDGFGADDGTLNSLNVVGTGTIDTLASTTASVSQGYTPVPVTTRWVGTLKMTGFGLGAGATQGISMNNTNIRNDGLVLMNVWIEGLGGGNDPPIFTRVSQGIGNMTFTLKNPGATAYTNVTIVIQYLIL